MDPEPNPASPEKGPGELSAEAAAVTQAIRGRFGYLYKQYAFLETLVALTISALILSSLGLNLFLFKQMRLVRGQLSNQKEVSTAMLAEFYKKREPAIRSFVTKLQAYAETDSEFRVILDRYRPQLAKYFAGPGQGEPVGVPPPE